MAYHPARFGVEAGGVARLRAHVRHHRQRRACGSQCRQCRGGERTPGAFHRRPQTGDGRPRGGGARQAGPFRLRRPRGMGGQHPQDHPLLEVVPRERAAADHGADEGPGQGGEHVQDGGRGRGRRPGPRAGCRDEALVAEKGAVPEDCDRVREARAAVRRPWWERELCRRAWRGQPPDQAAVRVGDEPQYLPGPGDQEAGPARGAHRAPYESADARLLSALRQLGRCADAALRRHYGRSVGYLWNAVRAAGAGADESGRSAARLSGGAGCSPHRTGALHSRGRREREEERAVREAQAPA